MNILLIKMVFRDINKSKVISTIAITGLAVGLAATIILLTYVRHEFIYDHFHYNAKRIYRINSVLAEDVYPICIGLKDNVLQKQVPEIDELLQIYDIHSFNSTKLIYENTQIKDINLIYSTENIHKVFTLNYLKGNPEQALIKPNTIVLTESIATKLFGSTDVLGKVLKTNHSKHVFTVSGIIEDYPSTSHLKIDAIIPIESAPFLVYNGGLELKTYVLFNENADI